ncbi:cell division topological specificity factor homolog, chloroplastic-like [Wolffia australiana]
MADAAKLKLLLGSSAAHPKQTSRRALLSASSSSFSPSSKARFCGNYGQRWSNMEVDNRLRRQRCPVSRRDDISAASVYQDAECFVLTALTMSFSERLSLAWRILFPGNPSVTESNAKVAKQRLKMILFSDRCAVGEDAKQKIVGNIIDALSDFVEIESQEKVQLNVSTEPNLGTVYSVTIPVRRVKPEHQDYDGYIESVV